MPSSNDSIITSTAYFKKFPGEFVPALPWHDRKPNDLFQPEFPVEWKVEALQEEVRQGRGQGDVGHSSLSDFPMIQFGILMAKRTDLPNQWLRDLGDLQGDCAGATHPKRSS